MEDQRDKKVLISIFSPFCNYIIDMKLRNMLENVLTDLNEDDCIHINIYRAYHKFRCAKLITATYACFDTSDIDGTRLTCVNLPFFI